MSFIKKNTVKNVVKACLSEYLILMRGEPKVGKSTLYADLVKEFYGKEEAGFMIPFETGYKAIDGLNVFGQTISPGKNCVFNDETGEEEEYNGWKLFTMIVDDLVETRKDNGIKVVCIDTIDRFFDVAIEETLRMSRIETKKPCKSLNDAFNGYGKGRVFLSSLVKAQFQRLRDSGYGIVVIGHVKHKTIKDKIQQEEYQMLASNLTEDLDSIVANDADFILMLSNEKTVKDGLVAGSERYIRFRGDGYYSAGSRFQHLPEKISLSAKGFVDAFNIAVKGAGNLSDEELLNARVKQAEARQKDADAIAVRNDAERGRILDNIKKAFSEATDVTKADMVKRFSEYSINPKDPMQNKVENLRAFAEMYGL
ncbi:MAG: AAA family ATPase [Fusobacteriaceae bacterium]